jgi:hypothetical protein
MRAELTEHQRLMDGRRPGGEYADAPVPHFPAVTVRAVQHVGAPALREAGNVGQLVPRAGGQQDPPGGDAPVADRDAKELGTNPPRSAGSGPRAAWLRRKTLAPARVAVAAGAAELLGGGQADLVADLAITGDGSECLGRGERIGAGEVLSGGQADLVTDYAVARYGQAGRGGRMRADGGELLGRGQADLVADLAIARDDGESLGRGLRADGCELLGRGQADLVTDLAIARDGRVSVRSGLRDLLSCVPTVLVIFDHDCRLSLRDQLR